jgi:hypothetical protein
MAEILDGETDSDVIDLTGLEMQALVCSTNNFTGTHLCLLYQVAQGVWMPVIDSFGRTRQLTVKNGWVTALDSDQRAISRSQVFKFRSDAEQDGNCTLSVVTAAAA